MGIIRNRPRPLTSLQSDCTSTAWQKLRFRVVIAIVSWCNMISIIERLDDFHRFMLAAGCLFECKQTVV